MKTYKEVHIVMRMTRLWKFNMGTNTKCQNSPPKRASCNANRVRYIPQRDLLIKGHISCFLELWRHFVLDIFDSYPGLQQRRGCGLGRVFLYEAEWNLMKMDPFLCFNICIVRSLNDYVPCPALSVRDIWIHIWKELNKAMFCV